MTPDVLSGPVAVCVDRPLLSLDRPFTYDLSPDLGAGVGSLVQVPFHGRAVRAWVLGPTDDVPARVLAVKARVSPVRFFDERMLEVLRWVSERYVAPLATVIARSVPPRIAGEEEPRGDAVAATRSAARAPSAAVGPPLLARYRSGPALEAALREGIGELLVRPAPEDEQRLAVEAVGAALGAGRSSIVLVPEADPLPATARAVADAFGEDAVLFVGGSRRARYRAWLDIAGGRYRVVVGTRPAVFAPLRDLGLVYVSRESHAGHREDRAPYYHVRDVALARARIARAACVLAALCPTAEAAALGLTHVVPAGRWWPPVEVVRPGPEGRAPRLLRALRQASRGFVYSPLPGYGVARVCRTCGEPAACASCGGVLRSEEGEVRCAVCGAPGRCAACGGADFGIAPGGAERVEEWARRAASVPVRRVGPRDVPTSPGEHELLVGGVETVKDFGAAALGLDLVGILDADLAARRPGLAARERALATWMEAASWARPNGRVIVQTRTPNDPAVQALVAGDSSRFYRSELARRTDAGFPARAAVFRVAGTDELVPALEAMSPITLLGSAVGGETLCLLALELRDVPAFGRAARELAARGVVTRVEAEPHL